MTLDVDNLLKTMLGAAATAFGTQWSIAKGFVPSELKKMAMQLADIAGNVTKHELDPNDGYPIATGRILLQMQRQSLEATLTAVTALTLIAVQSAIDKILQVVKATFGQLLGVVGTLLPLGRRPTDVQPVRRLTFVCARPT
jgi:hypothetical protein